MALNDKNNPDRPIKKVQGPAVEAVTGYAILQLKVAGHSNWEIAQALGVSRESIQKTLAEVAAEVRQNKLDLVDQQFTLHLLRTEDLYNKTYKRLEKLLDADEEALFTRHKEILDSIRTLLLILARQSTLMGLDANKTKSANEKGGKYDWVSDPNVSEDRLVSEARRLGLRVPSSFGGEEDVEVLDGGVPGAESA